MPILLISVSIITVVIITIRVAMCVGSGCCRSGSDKGLYRVAGGRLEHYGWGERVEAERRREAESGHREMSCKCAVNLMSNYTVLFIMMP